MSRRCRSSKAQLHVHCESCYSRRCRTKIEVSVSCAVIPCRLQCGALFHLCKEEDHLLLCPNVRVPCLNAEYGCPNHMPRCLQAAHLQVCPASVVSCSAEWLRWPTDNTSPHDDAALQENVLKEYDGQQAEALDLAMTLVDQRELYARLKMRPLYPELMEEGEEEEEEEEEVEKKEDEREEGAMGGLINGVLTNQADDKGSPTLISEENGSISQESGVGEGATEQSVGSNIGISTQKYNLIEMMFSMERGACKIAQENLDNPKSGETGKGLGGKDSQEDGRRKSGGKDQKTGSDQRGTATGGGDAEKQRPPPPDTSKMGQAPWQDGVLERLGKELSPQEFNMYLVHHGRMLLTFGQIVACTPREKDFVYGSLEPIPVQTLRTFKVPDSYHYKRRVYDTIARVKTEVRSVDTSDLGAKEEDWNSDEAETTLLGYAEREVMGHKISESKVTDGLYFDVGMQTHSFRTAPFKRTTTLAEVMVDRPLKVRLQLQAECVTSRHHKGCSVFTFICGHTFHRKDFPRHFRNVHSDIQTCLSGWFEQRCPLAYLGCTYSQRRFQPSTHKATVTYNQELSCLNLRPIIPASLGEGSQRPPRSSAKEPRTTTQKRRGGRGGGGVVDSLSDLPYEVLCHMASFLDSLSLSQLALVSRLMRDVCSSQLQDRGMVTLSWDRKTLSRKGAKWEAKTVWQFSHLFSPVDSWHFAETPSISTHLKVCPYYKTSLGIKPVPLPSMSGNQESNQERQSLVTQLLGNR